MNDAPSARTAGLVASLVLIGLLGPVSALDAQSEDSLARTDHELLLAMQGRDQTLLEKLLDAEFIWIDSSGRRFSRSGVIRDLPSVANADVKIQARDYDNVAVVRANRGRVNVLRVWVKRPTGWRALFYQEVTQVEKSESPGGTRSEECINPCKTIPY